MISRSATRAASERDLTPRIFTASSVNRVSTRIDISAAAMLFSPIPCGFLRAIILLAALQQALWSGKIFGLRGLYPPLPYPPKRLLGAGFAKVLRKILSPNGLEIKI